MRRGWLQIQGKHSLNIVNASDTVLQTISEPCLGQWKGDMNYDMKIRKIGNVIYI